MKRLNVRAFVAIGMLSSLAFVLMLIKFPIPPFPAYLSVDFSDIPALIAAFLFGPLGAILVALFKNIIHYLMTGSETGIPIGNFANFAASILFVLPTYFVFNRLKVKRGLAISLIVGTLFMSVFMSILNYVAILPAYTLLLGWPAMSGSVLKETIVLGILPFNVIKGLIVALVFLLLYSRMHVWINKQIAYKNV